MAERVVPLVAIALVPGALLVFAIIASSDEDSSSPPDTNLSDGTPAATVGVQLSDLPSGYEPKSGFPKQFISVSGCVNALAPGLDAVPPRLQALGLEGCYLSIFSKNKGNDSNSPGSGAYFFRDTEGATKALPILRGAGVQSLRPQGAARLESSRDVPVTGLGDQAEPGVTTTLAVGATRKFAITLYFWRSRNVVFYAGGGDSLGDFNEKSYLDLSKKVASRAGA